MAPNRDHSYAEGESQSRKIVICLDGTNDEIGKGHPSNPAKVFEMLDLDSPAEQVAYYDPGIGTLPATNARGELERRLSRVAQLAIGAGLAGKLAGAYDWLMQNYRPGDEIYVFGFSRGAYIARALVAMIARPGLLRSGSGNLVRYAVIQYARDRVAQSRDVDSAREFADTLCWGTAHHPMSPRWPHDPDEEARVHSIPVEYLGIWDTVQATGLGQLGQIHWPGTDELWNVRRLRHAVSIDEWRRPYKPVPVKLRNDGSFQEVWFAGVHSDVGGTFDNCELATIALKWVFDGACRQLKLRDGDPITAYRKWCLVEPGFAQGPINRMQMIWRLAGTVRRAVPADAVLHDTVRLRRERDSAYGPQLPDFTSPGRFTDAGWMYPGI